MNSNYLTQHDFAIVKLLSLYIARKIEKFTSWQIDVSERLIENLSIDMEQIRKFETLDEESYMSMVFLIVLITYADRMWISIIDLKSMNWWYEECFDDYIVKSF